MQEIRQQQMRQQMNDFNRRQHAVVQRMSAYDRYKRKKTTMHLHKAAATKNIPRALPPPPSPNPTTTGEQQTANESSQSRESSAERLICNAEALFSHSAETCDQIAQYFEKRKQLVVDTIPTTTTTATTADQQHQSSQPNDTSIAQQQKEINDGWKRLQNNLQKDAKTYKELANLLRHGTPCETIEPQQEQQEMCNSNGEPSKREVERREFRELIMGIVESSKSERERRAADKLAAEQTRIRLAQIDEEQRARAKKRHDEFEERSREVDLYLRQFDKRMQDYKWHKVWMSRRPQVVQRRANQAANAG